MRSHRSLRVLTFGFVGWPGRAWPGLACLPRLGAVGGGYSAPGHSICRQAWLRSRFASRWRTSLCSRRSRIAGRSIGIKMPDAHGTAFIFYYYCDQRAHFRLGTHARTHSHSRTRTPFEKRSARRSPSTQNVCPGRPTGRPCGVMKIKITRARAFAHRFITSGSEPHCACTV